MFTYTHIHTYIRIYIVYTYNMLRAIVIIRTSLINNMLYNCTANNHWIGNIKFKLHNKIKCNNTYRFDIKSKQKSN